MSVYLAAKGTIVYESLQELQSVVEILRKKGYMDDENRWVNEAREPFNTSLTQVQPEYNCLTVPTGYSYRNFPTREILDDIYWARLGLFSYNSSPYEITVHDAEGVIERINLTNWAKETQSIDWEIQDPDWVLQKYFPKLDTDLPERVKTKIQRKKE